MTPEDRERYDHVDRQLETLREITKSNSEQIARHTEQIGQLATRTGELQELMMRLGRVVEEQARALSRTDERLNILISVVERYFSNGSH